MLSSKEFTIYQLVKLAASEMEYNLAIKIAKFLPLSKVTETIHAPSEDFCRERAVELCVRTEPMGLIVQYLKKAEQWKNRKVKSKPE